MLRLILSLFFVVSLFAGDDSFITKYEYAKMLYENPRGVGCNNCHGKYGKGKVIATYKHKKKLLKLKAPDITKLPYEKFFKTLNSKKNSGAMPKYFLTSSEIKALYYYIKKVNIKAKK